MCSLALLGNGLISSNNDSSHIESSLTNDYTQISETYEEKSIGILPNESHINGYSQDVSKFAKDSAYSTANMVNYDLNSGVTSFEYFDPNSYSMKGNANIKSFAAEIETARTLSLNDSQSNSILTSEAYVPDDVESNYSISPNTIIGPDDRIQVSNPKNWPYRATCKLYIEYDNVYNQVTGRYVTLVYVGTGFMEGPNLLVTAGHCAYGDVTNDGNYQDNVSNPRFPNRIRVYAGADGSSDITSSYSYYATVSKINIQKEYYENPIFDYDWAACQLNWNLGNVTEYYGKISNWYVQGADVYSYGYPGEKGNIMWEEHGKTVSQTDLRFDYDFDVTGGQSGSPVFMTADDGSTYVCNILTAGGLNSNGGTKINSFIFHYLNSFVTNRNYEHSVGSISPDEYGFEDAYPTDLETRTKYEDHYTSKNFHFQTVRYRTGYIHNEYIVMSCMRANITEAFIEYKFDIPISKLTVQLSHWRERAAEWLDKNTGIAELQYWDNDKWNQKLDLLSDETALPRDRTNPKTYTITFNEPVTRIRFYEKSNTQHFNDYNRGRICIGDITLYSKENNV